MKTEMVSATAEVLERQLELAEIENAGAFLFRVADDTLPLMPKPGFPCGREIAYGEMNRRKTAP